MQTITPPHFWIRGKWGCGVGVNRYNMVGQASRGFVVRTLLHFDNFFNETTNAIKRRLVRVLSSTNTIDGVCPPFLHYLHLALKLR